MSEVVESIKYPSLPSNYVSIAHLQEKWLKEKQRKQQQENEENKQYPVPQNHQNYSGKSWREVGLIGKEPKLKGVEIITDPVDEEGEKQKKKKKKGYFGKRKPGVARDMAKELCKGKYKEVEEVCMVEVVGRSNVDREIEGERSGVGFKGKMGDGVGEVSEKGVRMRGAFCGYGDKEVAASVCAVEVVGENEVYREIAGQKCGVGFRGKKHSRNNRFGVVNNKANNAEKEKVSVDVNESTDEKVKVSDAFRAYGDKEVEDVATVCAVEVVEENKVDSEITGQKCRVGFKGKKYSWRKIGDGVGQVSDKANSLEQSGQEHNAEKEKVSIDVKERTNEKVRVRGAFRAYGDKSKDVLIDSEAGLKMTIERDLGDLSLTDRRYGHGRSSVRGYGDKWRYGSSRRNEPRKMLKQRDNSFVWIKKGESSNGNAAEIVTQVDVSSQSQSPSRSKLCTP